LSSHFTDKESEAQSDQVSHSPIVSQLVSCGPKEPWFCLVSQCVLTHCALTQCAVLHPKLRKTS
jgi:hypothetical protein